MNKICRFFLYAFVLNVATTGVSVAATLYTLCSKKEYVAKCGDVTIGTNLLRGYSGTNPYYPRSPDVYPDETITTSDYYDYSEQNNWENLRKFLKANETFRYTKQNGEPEDAVTGVVGEHNGYKEDRNILLRAICDPSKVNITCAPCPDGGEVPGFSWAHLHDYHFNEDKWYFYSLANCSKTTFSDSTGEFEYLNDDGTTQSCYYSTENRGTTVNNQGTIIHSGTPADPNTVR